MAYTTTNLITEAYYESRIVSREFETVNGVAAKGGSIDGPGQIVVDGMLYVTSGNGGFFGRAGNVLLVFGLE